MKALYPVVLYYKWDEMGFQVQWLPRITFRISLK